MVGYSLRERDVVLLCFHVLAFQQSNKHQNEDNGSSIATQTNLG